MGDKESTLSDGEEVTGQPRLEWFSESILHNPKDGYVMFRLPSLDLPDFHHDGVSFEPKEELHCSLLCTQNIAQYFPEPEAITEQLTDLVEAFIAHYGIQFEGFTRDVYKCKKEEAQSIIIGARMKEVERLFSVLRANFSELSELPDPSLHVTLYKFNHQYGIGIQNEADLRELCTPLPFEQLPETLQKQL